MFGNWKAYIINMAMPYEKGKVTEKECLTYNVW